MDSIWANIFKGSTTEDEDIKNVLKAIPIFSDLTGREIGAVEKVLHKRQYHPGEVIFSQGVLGAGMYIIISGKVEIIYEPSGKLIAELSSGEFFGELSLLDETPRSATAVAKEPSKVLGFFQSDLFGLAERNPRLGMKIVLRLSRIIGRRLKHANEQAHELQEKLAACAAAPPDVQPPDLPANPDVVVEPSEGAGA